jgi:hypothetical protein
VFGAGINTSCQLIIQNMVNMLDGSGFTSLPFRGRLVLKAPVFSFKIRAFQPPFSFLHLQLRGKIDQVATEVVYENS